ncbi:MAG: hypothetical protein IPJ97_08235 [Proteobacteria bacterium]|nr:hypothetical protein [Pseudomonadota bacterium]
MSPEPEARAATPEEAKRAIDLVRRLLRGRLAEPTDEFTVVWAFRSAREELIVASVEETVTFHLVDAAYPSLPEGVHAFIQGFLASRNAYWSFRVPGHGQDPADSGHRGCLSKRKGRSAEILYSNDERVLHSDEFFVKFALAMRTRWSWKMRITT